MQGTITKTMLPPVGGLNARDALADMDEKDAITLDNFFPHENYVAIRKGFSQHRTGMSDPIRTLMSYYGTSGSDKLFAIAGDTIYDVTSAGSAATVMMTGLSSANWQYTNFETSADQYLVLVSGADTPLKYDGSSFSTTNISASGLTSTNLIHVCAHKERLWFVEKNSRKLWYLGTSQIASSSATAFPMGAVFKKGGFIQACGTFSTDTGSGPDDFFAVISSEGEVAVYQGTDPASANTWALVGLFDTGKPVGRRCLANVSGDLVIITTDGAVSMHRLLQFDRSQAERAAVTAKINGLFNNYVENYGANTGWQAFVYPEARYLIINVPTTTDSAQVQLVMNTITGAWCRFTDMNAGCWAAANGNLYFGGNAGIVYQANNGYTDNEADISGAIKTAFSYLGKRGVNKLWTAVRPIIISGGAPGFRVGLDTDFQTTTLTGGVQVTEVEGAVWGSMVWPWQWGGSNYLTRYWQTVGGMGFCGSIKFEASVSGQSCQVNSFDVLARVGGPY